MPTAKKVRVTFWDSGADELVDPNMTVYQGTVVEDEYGDWKPGPVEVKKAKDVGPYEGVWRYKGDAKKDSEDWCFQKNPGKKKRRGPKRLSIRVKRGMKKNHQASWIDLGDGTKYHYKPLPGGKGYEVHVPAGNGDKKIGVVSKMSNGKWHAKGKGKKLGGFESFKIATLYLLGKYKPTMMKKNPTVSPSLVLTAIGRELKARKYPGVKVVKPSSKHGQITAQLVFGAWKNGRKSEKLIVRVINFMDADRTIIDGLGTGATVKTAKSIPAEAKSYVDRIEQLGYAPKKPTAVKNPARKTLKRKAPCPMKKNSGDVRSVYAYLSRFKPGDEIDAWGLSRATGHQALSAEQILKDQVKKGNMYKDGTWYGFVEGVSPVTAMREAAGLPKKNPTKRQTLKRKAPAAKAPKAPKAPTQKQINTLAAEFKRLRAAASKKVPELMRTKLVLDSSVHDSARHFAMTRKLADGSWTIHAAPELAAEPKHIRIGVLRHEFGHSVLHDKGKVPKGNDALERATDREAEKLFGAKIYYDKRGVETTSSTGKRPRPAGLY